MIEYDDEFETMDMDCDGPGCTSSASFSGSFQECVDEAKGDGWRIKNVAGEWLHFCAEPCFEKWSNEASEK